MNEIVDERADTPLPLLSEPRVGEVHLIEKSAQLTEAIELLSRCSGPFALDAERASGFKYKQSAYLIQVHRLGSPIYLIDPVSVLGEQDGEEVMRGFANLMKTEEWILHAASQDLPCLRELGIEPSSIFDTELGSRLAGLPRVGLGAVTEQFLGLRLAKEHSAVDWSIRPLKADWLNYAALDVDVLIELRSAISELLESQGKTEWALQEFAHVVSSPKKPPKIDKWRGMTGLHDVKDVRSLAIARELWQARESLGEKLDVSPSRLIPDSSIVSQASNPAKSRPELASTKSFSGRASRTYLDTWWQAICEGQKTRDLPLQRLPNIGIPNHRTWANRFPEADQRLKAARTALAEVSEALGVPQENLLSPDPLRQVCFEPPTQLSAQALGEALTLLGARPWQVAIVSDVLSKVFLEIAPKQVA